MKRNNGSRSQGFAFRDKTIRRVKRRLLANGLPRLQMVVILAITGFAGFIASILLLHLGVQWMWVRYPLAIAAGYCIFLLLLRLWLALHRDHLDKSLDPPDVAVDIPIDLSGMGTNAAPGTDGFFGGSADFAGAGAGGGWDGASDAGSSGGASADIDIGIDLDDGWLILLAIAAALGLLIACFYVVWIAPALLAEIFVDGVMVTGLYKGVKRAERGNWLGSAVYQTLLPAVLAIAFGGALGYILQMMEPEARTFLEVWSK